MPVLTFAFCTYNRADRLEKLVAAMRAQTCPVPFEILAINNNSPDNTLEVLAHLQRQPGAPLRFVTETAPGIVPARNRALAEAISSDILAFIDDDEIPRPDFLNAAFDAIVNEGAQCAGGRIEIDFSPYGRPAWLDDDVAGFLGLLDHGKAPLWLTDTSTPIWSGNTAYAMQLFRDHPDLRFDLRYNRKGEGIGGGEDAMMLRTLLDLGTRIRYRSDMAVTHSVDPWKLKASYFLRLHYLAGVRNGQYVLPDYPKTLLGMPPFMVTQFLKHSGRTLKLALSGKPGLVRQAMNAAHALGSLQGYRNRSGA